MSEATMTPLERIAAMAVRLRSESAALRAKEFQRHEARESAHAGLMALGMERDADALEMVPVLFEALRGMLSKCRCGGAGKYRTDCDYCGDSTYDHLCNDRDEPCDDKGCIAARVALARATGQQS